MIAKPVYKITKADIDALLSDAVRESQDIDYKASLPGSSDEGKREFLADVSSFANSSGGDIVYGVTEAEGIPVEAHGLPDANADAEIQRLESTIRDGISPRIAGIQMQVIGGFVKGPVVLVRVPRSWASPHMVTFKNISRFYSRNNAGKHQMDVSEIRLAFGLSEAVPERLRRFRDERLGRIFANEGSIRLKSQPRFVVHVVPLASLSMNFQVYISQNLLHMPLIDCSFSNFAFNLDGCVTCSGSSEEGFAGYCQLFRSGRIESVVVPVQDKKEGKTITYLWYDNKLLDSLRTYLEILRGLSVPTPLVVMVSVLGARGSYISTTYRHTWRDVVPADCEALLLPERMIEDYAADLPTVLRPILDALWNAAGFDRCLNYDEKGNWSPRER